MATVTVTPACNNGISQNFAFEDNGSHLRVASFSSYLRSGEETFILKLGESTRIPPSTVVAAAESPYQLSLGRKYNEDDELGIFSAEKYFSGRIDEKETAVAEKDPKQQLNKEGKIDPPRPKNTSKSGTPSACSEASWNSQSALLRKDRSPNMQKQMNGKKFFGSFGCNCAGKKSIDIDEKVGTNRNSNHCKRIVDLGEEPHSPEIFIEGPVGFGQTRKVLAGNKPNRLEFQYGEEMDCRKADKGGVGLKREDRFTFPILNHIAGNLTVGKQLEEEKARISLEVFGSSYKVKEGRGSNLQRRLTMLTSDTGRRWIEDIPAASSGGGRGLDDDVGSESSSDLFEIESFSSKAHPFYHPQASDDMSSCTATPTRYEPSEASIEWSVVTASASNFSVSSDYDNQRQTEQADLEAMGMATTTTTTAKATHRRQPTSLLGCKSSKAVKVVANAHTVSEKLESDRRRRLQSDSMAPFARFQAENAQRGLAMHYLSRSNATHATHTLYMH